MHWAGGVKKWVEENQRSCPGGQKVHRAAFKSELATPACLNCSILWALSYLFEEALFLETTTARWYGLKSEKGLFWDRFPWRRFG